MADTTLNSVQLHVTDERVAIDASPGAGVLTAEAICQLLQQAGISHGVDKEAIEAAIDTIKNGEPVQDWQVASQIAPKPGKPSSLERVIQIGQVAAPGDTVLQVVAGEASEHGFTVKGNLIEAPPPPPTKVSGGENTVVDYGKLKATAYGVVKFKDNLVSVVPPLQVAFDKLSATLDIHPASQLGTPISKDAVFKMLAAFGIQCGIDHAAIDSAINEAKQNNATVFRVEVAKGTAAVPATQGDYAFAFTFNGVNPKDVLLAEDVSTLLTPPVILELVEEGKILCNITPPTAAKPGKNIFGAEVKPPQGGGQKLPTLSCGENVEKNEATNEFIATILRCGYADIEDGKLMVRSPITVAQDQMMACLSIYPPGSSGRMIQKKEILELLSLKGINYGVDELAIDNTLESCAERLAPILDMPIVSGKHSKPGKDASLDYLIDIEQTAGTERADGTIDFKERGTIVNVKPGEAICKKIPPTPGQAQITIFGETFPASAGRDIAFEAGENVEQRGDTFYATREGALMVRDNKIHVSDVYVHQGDINLTTGNLHQNKGAIHITGSIHSGFEVKASGPISVNQMVDNGKIISGGDVAVKGGVIQRESSDGYIHCMGNVTVKFAQNAKIYSYQNITVGDFVMNGHLHAKGSVDVSKGKGCIVGGVVKASSTVKAKQLGSEAGAITVIEIEYDPKIVKKLNNEFEAKTQELEAGTIEQAEFDAVVKEQKAYMAKARENAAIIVEGPIFPGVTLKVLGVTHQIVEEKRFCKITLNAKNAMVFSPIK